jgi:hypothetical protein
MGDLLCNTFGDEPGKLAFIRTYNGGRLTVLEPMIMLYRMTGEPRYKDFCQFVLKCLAAKPGRYVETMLETKSAINPHHRHAYTLLSITNGLLEWYRITGDKDFLTAAVYVWEDITAKRL